MKIFSLFFLLLFFFACTQQQNDSEVVLAASPEQTLDLEGEILPIQELIPTSICRLDSFLVILNMEEEKIVRVYQADTYRFLGAFLEKGRGDDEVISCQEIWAAPWKGKMRLWLKAPQNFIGVVDLESSLTAGKPCWEKQYKFMDRGMADFLYRPVFVLNDSVFWISRAERPYDIIPNQNIRKNADGSIRILSNIPIQDVYAAYHNLWHVERAFRIAKSKIEIRPMFHFTRKRIEAHICICFVALKVYKELERMLKVSEIKMSVDKVLALAKTITTIQIKLPLNKEVYTQTMLMARHQKIAKLFDEEFWGTQ